MENREIEKLYVEFVKQYKQHNQKYTLEYIDKIHDKFLEKYNISEKSFQKFIEDYNYSDSIELFED